MRVLRLLAALALIGGLFVGVAAESPALIASTGERDVQRVRAYELGVGADPTFGLHGGDTLLRVVTNVIVDPTTGADDTPYAIAIGIQRPGAAEEVRTLHLRSYRSGLRTATPEPCFDANGTPIADARHVDLPLDPPAEPGTQVVVRAVGTTHALVRGWSWQPREAEERARRKLALDLMQRRELGDPLGVLSWDHLTTSERAHWTTGHFARLAANGKAGADHLARDFFVRANLALVVAAEPPGTPLTSPMTWLVQGPATVRVAVTPTLLSAPATVRLRRSAAEEVELTQATLDGPWEWSGDLPTGLQTLILDTTGAPTVNVHVDIPGAARVPPTDDASRVTPATSTLRAAPIGPSTEAVLDAEVPADPEVRTVEIELWSAEPEVRLTVRGAGADLQTTVVLLENTFDVTVDAYGQESALRGPTRLKLLLPVGAREVGVRADVPALVRFRVPLHPAEPEPELPTVRQIGAADTPATRAWVRPLAPSEEVEIRVKHRVEPLPVPPPPPADWVATSLDPLGLALRFEALERINGPLDGRLLTEVRERTRVRAGSGQTRARITYELANADLLGVSVPYSVDGQVLGTLRAAVRRGSVRLPNLAPGDHTIEAAPPEGLRLFVNLPPAAGESAPALRSRTLWRVSDPVELTVRTTAAGPKALNIVVYDRSSQARTEPSVHASVDGGAPRRRSSGVYTRSTPATRSWPLPVAAHPDPAVLVDGDRASAGLPRTLILPLGDDLTPGVHTVRVWADRPTYMRFFAVTPPGLLAEPPTLTWEPESTLE